MVVTRSGKATLRSSSSPDLQDRTRPRVVRPESATGNISARPALSRPPLRVQRSESGESEEAAAVHPDPLFADYLPAGYPPADYPPADLQPADYPPVAQPPADNYPVVGPPSPSYSDSEGSSSPSESDSRASTPPADWPHSDPEEEVTANQPPAMQPAGPYHSHPTPEFGGVSGPNPAPTGAPQVQRTPGGVLRREGGRSSDPGQTFQRSERANGEGSSRDREEGDHPGESGDVREYLARQFGLDVPAGGGNTQAAPPFTFGRGGGATTQSTFRGQDRRGRT